jgi:serine/threonine protein kinase
MLFRHKYFPEILPHLIKENGKLKNPDEEKIILQKFTKEGITLFGEKDYLYIKGNNGVYVIYRHPISEGNFGRICSGYNILTGEWIAAKFIPKRNQTKDNECENECESEYKSLQTVKKLIENQVFFYQNNEIILIELAKGQEIFGLRFGDKDKNKKAMTWPLSLWLEICIKMLKALQDLHDLYLIHGDFKGENALYSLAHDILQVVDYGASGKMEHGVHQKKKFNGTFQYCPPEFAEGQPYRYTAKTDMYSTGIFFHEIIWGDECCAKNEPRTIAEFELLKEFKSSFVSRQRPLSKDPILREHIKSMHSNNPRNRPSPADSLNFFTEYTKHYNLQHPSEVIMVSNLKEDARRMEYQRISEAKIDALEPWKALQGAMTESKYFYGLTFFMRADEMSLQVKQNIEAALLNEDIVNAREYAIKYIKQHPDKPFAQALKKKFKLYLLEDSFQYQPTLKSVSDQKDVWSKSISDESWEIDNKLLSNIIEAVCGKIKCHNRETIQTELHDIFNGKLFTQQRAEKIKRALFENLNVEYQSQGLCCFKKRVPVITLNRRALRSAVLIESSSQLTERTEARYGSLINHFHMG